MNMSARTLHRSRIVAPLHVPARQAGVGLIEVMIALVVLSIGLLALASLQTTLLRGSADSKARTSAVNMAERMIEDFRGFQAVTRGTEPSGARIFDEIADQTTPIVTTQGGTTFSMTWDVTDYSFERDATTGVFEPITPPPVGVTPAFKRIAVTVDWATAAETEAAAGTCDDNGDGTVDDQSCMVLADILSQTPSTDSARTLAGEIARLDPEVRYRPLVTDAIIPIARGTGEASESSDPFPDVIVDEVSTITSFEVVTYREDGEDDPLALRKEEFLAVTCVCQQDGLSTATDLAFAPVVWDGREYTDPAPVEGKRKGTRADDREFGGQPSICETCCRDHHDIGDSGWPYDTVENVRVNPFLPDSEYSSGLGGDHAHYFRDANGDLIPADGTGEVYYEACRMMRVDGIFQVATDFNLESYELLRQEDVSTDAGRQAYGDFAEAFVDTYARQIYSASGYPQVRPTQADINALITEDANIPQPPDVVAITLGPSGQQQMFGRGIYIDYMTETVRDAIACIVAGSFSGDCAEYDGYDVLDVVPVFAVNITRLANWQSSASALVAVSNDPLTERTDTEFTRGRISASAGLAGGFANITSTVKRGNTGLTSASPINPIEGLDLFQDALRVEKSGVAPPPPVGTIRISGRLRAAGGLSIDPSADMSIRGFGPGVSQCAKVVDGDTYECFVPRDPDTGAVAAGVGMTVGGYVPLKNGNVVNTWLTWSPTTYSCVRNPNLTVETTTLLFAGLTADTVIDILVNKPTNSDNGSIHDTPACP
jgi:type II secretory pathway pseudopilin PulG